MDPESVTLTWNEAASGIFGSISLACWIFLLVPQLIENYRTGSAEALSLAFLFTWLVGDVTNLVGALGVNMVPVAIALAVYFCFADAVLILQCLYYNIHNSRKAARHSLHHHRDSDVLEPTTPLLGRRGSDFGAAFGGVRRGSTRSHRSRRDAEDAMTKILEETEPTNAWAKNIFSVVGICIVGAAGWAIAWQTGAWQPTPVATPDTPQQSPLFAVILGYTSAVCYLGARLPQIYKNYRDKSCEGLSLLFFILSLMGNATYGAGILFHSTDKKYFITNLPWLIGSLGTMVEDAVIFVQFRIYSSSSASESTSAVE